MAWVQAFPTGTTLISASVTQIQQNWLFLQTNIGTDHFFDTGTATEGHHQWVATQIAGDPVLQLDGMYYTKLSGTFNQPFFLNVSSAIGRQFPLATTGSTILANAVGQLLFSVIGVAPFYAILMVVNPAVATTKLSGFLTWDGVNLSVSPLSNSGTLSGLTTVGTQVRVNSSAIQTVSWAYMGIQI